MAVERTQVAIIGAGPAGLILSQLLHRAGVSSLIVERQSRAHVEGRIRAGVLEPGTVALLAKAEAGDRLRAEGLTHEGFALAVDGEAFRIDLAGLTGGQTVSVYGQTEITKDLIEAHMARGATPVFEAADVRLENIAGPAPAVHYSVAGEPVEIVCDFIAGCDGSHGVSRASIPTEAIIAYGREYPFGWLGILADVPPCSPELIYSSSSRGFALASMRSQTRSRYYVQCGLAEDLAAWSDARLWDEIDLRLGPAAAGGVQRGPALEKSIAPLRSCVFEPLRHGRLFLAGDAAHIVPPTGAKGLNLAAADVGLLAEALAAYYGQGSEAELQAYSARALRRVWRAERFSWWFTRLTHRFDDMDGFDLRLQRAELDYLRTSRAAQTVLAENYVGLRPDAA